MNTEQTGKVIGSMTDDMLVRVYKPIGTGENSLVYSATLKALKDALNQAGGDFIPLAGTTEMEAAEITHTSTGKTASVGFVDGSVSLTAIGADGSGTISAGEDTTIVQYDSAVSGYSSIVTLSDGVFELSVNGVVIRGEWDGNNQKLAFFGATPVVKAAAIADPTDLLSLLTAVPALLAAMRAYGLIAE